MICPWIMQTKMKFITQYATYTVAGSLDNQPIVLAQKQSIFDGIFDSKWEIRANNEKLFSICSFSLSIFCPSLQVCTKFECVAWILLEKGTHQRRIKWENSYYR